MEHDPDPDKNNLDLNHYIEIFIYIKEIKNTRRNKIKPSTKNYTSNTGFMCQRILSLDLTLRRSIRGEWFAKSPYR
jgi:hypothetical protein